MNNAKLAMVMILLVHIPHFTLFRLLLAHFRCIILQCNIVQCEILLKSVKTSKISFFVAFIDFRDICFSDLNS